MQRGRQGHIAAWEQTTAAALRPPSRRRRLGPCVSDPSESTSARPGPGSMATPTEGGSGMAAQQPDIKHTDLQQHNLSVPGHEVVQARPRDNTRGRSRQ